MLTIPFEPVVPEKKLVPCPSPPNPVTFTITPVRGIPPKVTLTKKLWRISTPSPAQPAIEQAIEGAGSVRSEPKIAIVSKTLNDLPVIPKILFGSKSR
jgi:hypothetical protein